ncbi:MAG: DUF4982 domain-containing protein [Bacteroidales bacterium]|nr:DUF4982 domain-containing protein [Candidatus Minthousia equi]
MKKLFILMCAVFVGATVNAQNVREKQLFDEGWKFSLGNAANPVEDFGSGTEYFNYLTKANSIHNEGPYSAKFDDSKWTEVRLPHDWALQVPYAPEASHSHGYRTVGYKYPKNSVGWYRKVFRVEKEDEGKHIMLQFDGIFRNATVWVNGFYMGVEPSGYATQVYDVTDYLKYGEDNIVAVRADATLEEGWFYEGAGIYRDAWLLKMAPVHVAPFGTFVYSELKDNYTNATLHVETTVQNSTQQPVNCQVQQILLDGEGNEIARAEIQPVVLRSREDRKVSQLMTIAGPNLWDLDTPYLYTVKTQVLVDGKVVDSYQTTTGIREVKFTVENGFFLNGKNIKLKGVNMHQDQAGVGAAIPDALLEYRIRRLKSFGCNAYRSSHNPMTPAMLDVCDRLGMLVIDENRLMGVNDIHQRLLKNMIERDRNHPSVILWSVGNEEWGIEGNFYGPRLGATMRDFAHLLDPTRLVTAASAGGREITKPLDVAGYNYIIQNDVDGEHKRYPQRMAYGSEETTACGTRGIYYDDRKNGRMASMNRTDTTYTNIIERGWKFYAERPWTSGIFYWTGFDYRGEPNPLSYPAVGSEFGILDYCGFEKDEAYYLKAWWTNEPVLHIFPHWNLKGHEGEQVEIWAYSNCDEVELTVNGKKLGKKAMPVNGHLSWTATYQPGTVKAVGYRKGKKVQEQIIATTGDATQMQLVADRAVIKADNRDVSVVNIVLKDAKGRVVPTACNDIELSLEGNGRILGVGNGDPAFKGDEHSAELECHSYKVPAFNGYAQVLLQANKCAGQMVLKCKGASLKEGTITIETK